MIQTILVPTDGSPHAEKAVSFAGELARLYGAKIILLHALPDTIYERIPEAYRELAHAEHMPIGDALISVSEEIVRCAKKRLRELGLKEVTIATPRGPAPQAILDYIKEHPVDMVVMGSRGLSDLEGMMLGSVSHKVSHLAPCSCLVVR